MEGFVLVVSGKVPEWAGHNLLERFRFVVFEIRNHGGHATGCIEQTGWGALNG